MTSEGVTLRRLGDVSPHVKYVGTDGRDYVDPAPVVLWGGARPAAVLYLGVESKGGKAVQRFAPVDASVRLPGFPVTVAVEAPDEARSMDDVDAIDTTAVISADVDGDGVQELVLVWQQGGVQVHSLRGPVAQLPSPSAGPGGARYRRFLAFEVPAGGREIVYVLSVCDAPGVDDRNLLVRVDGRSVTRVRLEGLERAEILALGAIQRPGSLDADELLVLTADGASGAALGRWRPDGRRIAPPRRMYVRPSRESAFQFVPASSHAVLEVQGGVLVLSPEKPANWIRELKPAGKPNPRELNVLSVADLDGDPKLQYAVGDALWAVNHDGTAFAPAGGGRWTPLAKPAPYLRVPVPAGETLGLVWRSDAGPLLAVSSRTRGLRATTHEELAAAADRFLPSLEAARYRKLRNPSLEGRHLYRDERMAEEREKRRVTSEIRTVDDWKRLLPDSYADVARFDRKTHDAQLPARFAQLRDDPEELARTPDPAGLRAFLGGLDVPARTTFLVVDGTAVSTVQIPGAPMRLLETQLGGLIEYRLAQGRIDAVLALEAADDLGRAPPAFYEVEAPLAARR